MSSIYWVIESNKSLFILNDSLSDVYKRQGSVVITYDTKKTYEEKIVKWINKVIDIVLGDFKLIEENGQDNLEFVIDTLEQKLNEEMCIRDRYYRSIY